MTEGNINKQNADYAWDELYEIIVAHISWDDGTIDREEFIENAKKSGFEVKLIE